MAGKVHGGFEDDHRIFIAIAEACQRERDPSYSWHVVAWMSQRLQSKYAPSWGPGVLGPVTST